MTFTVKFIVPSLQRGKIMYFGKEGRIHLFESGMILEGMKPVVSLPFVYPIIRRVFSEECTLSVPYALIERHASPTFLRRYDRLWIDLRMTSKRRQEILAVKVRDRGDTFRARIQEYTTVARRFVQVTP